MGTVPLSGAEYIDLHTDAELVSGTALAGSVENRPTRPISAPVAVIPFTDTTVTPGATTIAHVYAISFVTGASIEGPVSKSSGVVKVVNGVTAVNITHNETVSSDVIKKRIYRQTVTYSGTGTYTVTDSAYRLVAEVPVSQSSYTDTAADGGITGNDAPAVQNGIDEPPDGSVDAHGAVASLPAKTIRATHRDDSTT